MEFSVGLKIILKLKLAMHIGGYVGHGSNANHMHYTDSLCDANAGQNSGESMMFLIVAVIMYMDMKLYSSPYQNHQLHQALW